MIAGGMPAMVRIQLRTGWKTIVGWVLALAATLVATTLSIDNLYPTQSKIDSYAEAVTRGNALEAINGHVRGIDTVGGVIANEFGFVASFALPLMGVALIARSTRREEESGRLEVLLAGMIHRSVPLLASLAIAVAALALTCLSMAGGLATVSVAATGVVLYPVSLGALGLLFAAVAAVTAQLVEHAREVYTASLGALVVAYLLRGAGDVSGTALTWLSPLGWAEQARPFGEHPRWWPILLTVAAAGALIALAFWLTLRRELGDALIRRRPSGTRASAFLQTTFGFAVALQRGIVLRWAVLAALIGATMGALTQQVVDAVTGNESVADVLGATGDRAADGFLAMCVLLVAILISAYTIQAVGILRAEEVTGRLESTLSGVTGRLQWLGVQLAALIIGALLIAGSGGLGLGLAAGWSTGHSDQIGALLRAAFAYLPAVAILAGIALVVFGWLPRLYVVAWLACAVNAGVMLLGDMLQLPGWVESLMPMDHVGYPPQDPAEATTLAVLSGVAVLLYAAGLMGFRWRAIPGR